MTTSITGKAMSVRELIDEGYKLLNQAAIRIGPTVDKERNQLQDVISNMFIKSCAKKGWKDGNIPT